MKINLTRNNVLNFLKRIKFRNNGCWDWNGLLRDKTPVFTLGHDIKLPARRISQCIFFNETPDDYVLYTCGNSNCMNPAHMDTGKSCFHKLPKNYSTKKKPRITLKDINRILTLRKAGKSSMSISKKLGINYPNVLLIGKMGRLCQLGKLKKPLSAAQIERILVARRK